MARIISIKSFADAHTAGNPFLYLPRELRDKIYGYIVTDDNQVKKFKKRNKFIDAKEITMGNTKWYPSFCNVDDLFFSEILPVFLRTVGIGIGPTYTAWNLRFWLEALSAFENVRILRFRDPNALRAGVEAAQLLKTCTNLRELIIDITHSDVASVSKNNLENFLVIPKAFTSEFVVFEQVFQLKQIKRIVFPRLTALYGLDVWLKKEFEKRGVDVEVGM